MMIGRGVIVGDLGGGRGFSGYGEKWLGWVMVVGRGDDYWRRLDENASMLVMVKCNH